MPLQSKPPGICICTYLIDQSSALLDDTTIQHEEEPGSSYMDPAGFFCT